MNCRPLFFAVFLLVTGAFAANVLAADKPKTAAAAAASSAVKGAPTVTTAPAAPVAAAVPAFRGGDESAPYNGLIVQLIQTMPQGGGYSASHQAKLGLCNAVRVDAHGLDVQTTGASPSFCSGATYLLFLKAVANLNRTGRVPLDAPALDALRVGDQRDGQGIWGRWNANGPGTAVLFHQLGLGENFAEFERARPGDFMKIFWNSNVGRREHGHSVVFLGLEMIDGMESVRFWSSNIGMGYGVKVVPRAKIVAAIFSRLEHPERLSRAPALTPALDPYLASLLSHDSSLAEASERSGM